VNAPAVNVLVANALRKLAEDVTSPTLSRARIAELLEEHADCLVEFKVKEPAA
jgi:hypothetical protein